MNKKLLFLLLLFPFLSFSQSQFKKFQTSQKITKESFIAELKQVEELSQDNEFLDLHTKTDKRGVLHTYTQQYYKGIPIEHAYYSFHTKEGVLIAANGSINRKTPSGINPTITPANALNKAITGINAELYSWQNPNLFSGIKSENTSRFSSEPIPELVYYEVSSELKLCYKIEVLALQPQGRYITYINAENGALIKEINISTHVTGTCDTNYHGTQNIDFDETSPGQYQLTDATRNIQTFLLPDNSINYNSAAIPTSSLLDWSDISNANALDVQWSSQVVYDFLSLNGIQGYDGQNAPIISYVNYGNSNASKNNAFWNGAFLTYGSGGGNVFPGPLTTMDVVAHEIGHAVTENYGNGLLYFGESGAMNESYSDIIAAAVEHFVNGSGDFNNLTLNEWLMSDLNGEGIRDLSHPNTNDKPDTYEGLFWADTSSNYDNGGVHINSGIGNFWFYLLANGGSGTNDVGFNYDVSSIGIENAFSIALEAYSYLNYTSNFEDWRDATVFVASLNFGSAIAQQVAHAWEAVGVGPVNENFSFIAKITTNEVTQYCTNTIINFEGDVGADGTSQWYIDDILQPSNMLSFSSTGFHTVKLVNTYSEGEFAEDEIQVYAMDCNSITSNKNTWLFSDGHGFDFSNGIAEKITYPFGVSESTLVYSDDDGNLRFYLAGDEPFDNFPAHLVNASDNSIVATIPEINGSSVQLGATITNPQGTIVNLMMAGGGSSGIRGFYRLIVDIQSESVTIDTPITPINFPSGFQQNDDGSIRTGEALVAIPSCNENSFWIIVNSRSPRRMLVYKLDFSANAQGDLTFEQQFIFPGYPNSSSVFSSIEVSPNGNYLCSENKVFSFDRDTGMIDFLVDLPFNNFDSRYSSFSPNSQFIYLRDAYTIRQFDLLSDNIPNSGVDVFTVSDETFNMDFRLGPDHKIYIGHRIPVVGQNVPIRVIGVINNPNVKEVNNSVEFNPYAYRYDTVGSSIFIFPSFSEAESVDVVPLDFGYGENGCYEISLNTSGCRPYYNWDFGDGNSSNIQNPEHTYINPGEYQVSLTSVVSGEEVTVTKMITIGFDASGLEILGPDEACESDTILNGPLSFSEYLWSLPNGGGVINNQGDQFVNITWDSLGEKLVHLTVTDNEGCTALLTKTISVLNEDCGYNLGVEENVSISEVFLYPNPTTNVLFVKTNAFIKTYSIYDLRGSLLKTNVLSEDNLDFEIDLSEFFNGVYFIKFSNGNSSIIKRVIKN